MHLKLIEKITVKVYKRAAATMTLMELREGIYRLSVMRIKPEESDILLKKLSQTIFLLYKIWMFYFEDKNSNKLKSKNWKFENNQYNFY